MTLVKILHYMRLLIHELDIGGTSYMAFTNLMYEIVEDYHLFFGVTTRTMVQQLVYASVELPGDFLELSKAKSDILRRLERDYLKVSGKVAILNYTLPLDDAHLDRNPPMRRIIPRNLVDKSTQTDGRFHEKPVTALILN